MKTATSFLVLVSAVLSSYEAESLAADSKEPWTLVIAHPSAAGPKNTEYKCRFTIPAEIPTNSAFGGVSLALVNRDKKRVGLVHMYGGDKGEKSNCYEFGLTKDLAKESYLQFQVYPNEERMRFVKIRISSQKSIRHEGGRIVEEAIE